MTEATVPLKDPDQEHPVARAWRATLEQIVTTFVARDFKAVSAIPRVALLDEATTTQISDAIEDYGETLTRLPAATWSTSVAQWVSPHWEVLVDLWTAESGRSDLVLDLRVTEVLDGYEFTIHAVYVP